MSLLAWIVLGALAGLIAGAIMHSGRGLLWDVLIGIVGALIGGFAFTSFGEPGITGLNLWSLCVAVVGAVVLIALVRAVRGRPIADNRRDGDL